MKNLDVCKHAEKQRLSTIRTTFLKYLFFDISLAILFLTYYIIFLLQFFALVSYILYFLFPLFFISSS